MQKNVTKFLIKRYSNILWERKKTWTVLVIKGTNIAWTEIWNSYDVELDECAPEEYKFDATIKFAGMGRGYGSGAKVFV